MPMTVTLPPYSVPRPNFPVLLQTSQWRSGLLSADRSPHLKPLPLIRKHCLEVLKLGKFWVGGGLSINACQGKSRHFFSPAPSVPHILLGWGLLTSSRWIRNPKSCLHHEFDLQVRRVFLADCLRGSNECGSHHHGMFLLSLS